MPELPEVQTIVNDLQVLAGDTITGFWSAWEKSLWRNGLKSSEKKFTKEIVGAKIESISRKGKFIVISLSNSKQVLAHLRMTGQLLIMDLAAWNVEKKSKHIHHIFYLKKHGILAFSDVRKFGTLNVVDQNYQHPYFKAIDPFDKEFTAKKLSEILFKNKKRNIKAILLDQSLIAGIGNIYASEILFFAGINPLRNTESLLKNEVALLHKEIKKVLSKAIRMRGTSVSDYRDSSGKKGSFQKVLQVYKKHGQRCKKCDTIIQKTTIGQRSTFYCPKCQKMSK